VLILGLILNNQQDECVKMAVKWYKSYSSKQTFEISGPAGSGKTTIVKSIIQSLDLRIEDVLFVAYVGKAALQLTRSGVNGQTIHSAFYNIEFVPVKDEQGLPVIKNGKVVTRPQFVKKERIPKNIKLIVIDEAPMVNESFGVDIESFNIPIICLGDLQQLPPVIGGSKYLIRPDYVLTKIMRQAEGNPIIYLSQLAINGENIPYGKYGDKCYVIPKDMINDNMLLNADMIITPTNASRARYNKYIREELRGIESDLPVIGEKLICRKNNRNRIMGDNVYLVNGMLGYVRDVNKSTFNGTTIDIGFSPDFNEDLIFNNVKIDYKTLMQSIQTDNDHKKGYSMYDMFEFGDCITVHLSQGSQADNVLFISEPFGRDRLLQNKLNYTGITRAREGLIYAY
jgi:exodeoxyribonuclease-5